MTRIAALLFVWTVTQVFYKGSLSLNVIRNFRCDNGKYILNRYFCDGDNADCRDGSDESFGCSRSKCGAGSFDCGNGEPCINITGRCNTLKECPTGLDEFNCVGNETDIDHCSLHEGRYLCHDRLKCIDFNYTCDGACNCFDCSDETDHCKELNNSSCTSCSAYCLNTPNGPQCICDSNQYEESKFCKENFSSTNGQTCSRYRDSIRCYCHENHHEIHQLNGIKCRNNVWLEQMLIYSTVGKIKMLNITTNNLSKIIQENVDCAILTAAKDYLYYTDYRNKTEHIFKTPINGGNSEKIIELDSTMKSLAVDWITNNLYFTSSNSLMVCSNDGKICTRLKCCDVDYVALAPKLGWMFYVRNETRDNEQLIMKSNMDGSEEEIFVDTTFSPSITLAIDEWAETLYCFEMERMLYSFSLNDGSKKMARSLSREGFSTHFSVLERYSFFIKKNDNKIYNTTISDWYNFTTRTDEGTNKIRNLFTYNPLIQFTYEIENPCTTSSCNGLCLLRAASNKNYLNDTCMCENFIPSDDNSWCDDHTSRSILQLTSTKNEKLQTNPSTEPLSTFTLKKEASRPTKPTIVRPLPAESSSSETYPATGYFNNIMSCMTFALGVLILFILYRISYSIKYRRIVSSRELAEL